MPNHQLARAHAHEHVFLVRSAARRACQRHAWLAATCGATWHRKWAVVLWRVIPCARQVSNAVIATKMLGEPFRVNTLIGVVMTISGGVLFVTFAPEPPPDKVGRFSALCVQ